MVISTHIVPSLREQTHISTFPSFLFSDLHRFWFSHSLSSDLSTLAALHHRKTKQSWEGSLKLDDSMQMLTIV